MIPLPVPGLPIEKQPPDVLAAMLCWGEARGEGPIGMLAVLMVAMNRAYGVGWKPTDYEADKTLLRAAILKPWQFSAFNANDPNREKMLEPLKHDKQVAWHGAATVAALVLSGSCWDVTRGASHYCTATLWNTPGRKWFQSDEIAAGRTVETWRYENHVFARAA